MLKINKKTIQYLIICIPPFFYLSIISFFSKIRGPFYLGSNSDPSYAYLFNALSVSQGLPVGHLDHPGTPVQSLGAIVINFINFINDKPDVITEVLKNPEYFLNSIFIVIIMINTTLLLVVGIISFHLTKKLWVSLLLGFTPFFSIVILAGNLLVMPEHILLTASLILVISLLILFFTNKHLKLILFLSIVALGLGIASKIIFAPLLFIPLISIPFTKAKIAFILGCSFLFYLFTIPIVPFYSDLYAWTKALLFHSGIHGQGENAIINSSTYFTNIIGSLSGEPIYSIILLIAIIALIIAIVVRSDVPKKQIAILSSLIIAQILQVLLVAKHPGGMYLTSALCLSPITLIFTIFILSKTLLQFSFFKNAKLLPIIICLFFIAILYQSLQIHKLYFGIKKGNSEIISINKILEEKYSQEVVISYFRSSSRFYAMRFGNTFARDAYSAYLSNLYPNIYFWDIWNARFSDWSSRIVSIDEIIQKKGDRKIIFYGTSFDKHYADYPNYKPKLLLEDLINGKEETIYQVLLKIP